MLHYVITVCLQFGAEQVVCSMFIRAFAGKDNGESDESEPKQ